MTENVDRTGGLYQGNEDTPKQTLGTYKIDTSLCKFEAIT
jgi:hypothetical protein